MGLLGAFADPQFRKDVARGLLDAGNRGAVAGLLGGPVDLATMALRPFGYNVEQPVGGSEWIGQKMQNLGLVSEKRNPLAEGLAAFAGPMAAQQIAPKVFAAELRAMENMAKPSPMNAATRGQAGAIVWHGSPHKFDKFDSSKIGTGEGAQAYGHGLYVAESPEVAGGYMKNLSKDTFTSPNGSVINRAKLADMGFERGDIDVMLGAIQRHNGDFNAAAESMASHRPTAARFLKGIGDQGAINTGSLYKIDLPDEHIAKMLDWDKPLSQQAPEVQAAVSKFSAANVPASGLDMGGGARLLANHNGQVKPDSISPWVLKAGDSVFDISEKEVQRMLSGDKGEAAYTRLTALLGGQSKATEHLRQAGIPGIRYLDGGSRGAGTGTSNYVVFPGNEDLLRILERNGVPLP